MSSVPKVLQVLLSPRIGGAESLADALEQEWSRRGIESAIVYLDSGSEKRNRLRRIRAVRGATESFRPTHLVAHSYLPALYARLAVGRAVPVFSVLHSAHDDFESWGSRMVEWALLSVTAGVIAVSEVQRRTYAAKFPSALTTTIPNGVRPDLLPREHIRALPARVITVARVASQKRPEFWRSVIDGMAEVAPNVQFEWWGPLSESPSLDRYLLDLRAPNAEYMGSTTALPDVLERADIFFHPAEREAHSIALLEAVVAGMPVVYADSIEPPDESDAWRNTYRSSDVGDAIATLTRVLDSWDEVSQASQQLGPRMRQQYTVEKTASRYLEFIIGAAER